MANLVSWSDRADLNNMTPPDGWPSRTMQFSDVNNTGREMMAAMAQWYNDTQGVLTELEDPNRPEHSAALASNADHPSPSLRIRLRPLYAPDPIPVLSLIHI